MKNRLAASVLVLLGAFSLVPPPASAAGSAAEALRRGLDFMAGAMVKAPYGGGWPGGWPGDMSYGLGEAAQPIPKDCIRIQDPGTPAVGMAFLRAGVEFDPKYLEIAKMAGNVFVLSITAHGGWDYEMWIGPERPLNVHLYPGKRDWAGETPTGTSHCVYDDGVTFAAAEFVYALWWHTKDQKYFDTWKKAMDGLVANQLPGGGFPQVGGAGGYHAYATFNDFAMSNCVSTLLKAYQRTGDKKYYDSVAKCGDWLVKVQTPSGGYGTQYDGRDQVASARKFEPPALGPDATAWAIGILCQIYDATGDPKYLSPIGKAVDWLQKVKLGNGKWARFYHPGTDKAWYRSLSGQDVGSASQAKPGYVWEGSWGAGGISKGNAYKGRGAGRPRTVSAGGTPGAGVVLRLGGGGEKFDASIDQILAGQDERGAWPQAGRGGGGGSGKGGKGGKKGGGGGGGRGVQIAQFVSYVHALMDNLKGTTTAATPAEPGETPEEPAEPAEPETPAEPEGGEGN